ncbi:hypothetical protein M5K25_022484 [Dendrobium thyrsiflorum]|uniref:Uncharacterized protein n=1 Tax=Dendrobium thyrsiflorum TaxID=117978 RepID=A0ABD0UCG1_DENTH
MTAKKVDALEECLEGEMSQMKAMVKDRILSVKDKVFDLHEMVKKILENQIQTAASETKGPMGRTMNSKFCRRYNDVEIMEKGGRYGERRGYGGHEPRGAGREKKERGYGRKGANFEERRGESEEGFRKLKILKLSIHTIKADKSFLWASAAFLTSSILIYFIEIMKMIVFPLSNLEKVSFGKELKILKRALRLEASQGTTADEPSPQAAVVGPLPDHLRQTSVWQLLL